MDFEPAQIDLINQAYHQYGKTMFAAATMERSLVNAVVQHRHAAAQENGQQLAGDLWEKAAGEAMKKMIERLAPHLDKVPGLTDRLNAARNRRNDLAHTFCFDRAPDLAAPAPATRLIAELAADEETFLVLFAEVQKITRGLMEKAGIDTATANAMHVLVVEAAKNAQ
ncbi:hypothetical protein [Streptomyces poriferorum]|uniref:Uncharacterized protein n=1 Tax=Streptomyces poriferorum TaxID=2798799 RepID=A0ABY9J2E0_9ACTN|nr:MULTISPECIES: hypothetical protein [unclassified Streptomyces]MDP5317392.1 hypothetical protein [Streptomyces sp. Alt4]WLQ61998.1 hypothetical protein P8A19_41725 [Streptomyces sp. Alt2]